MIITKKEKRIQFNKDNILEAAEKLFLEKGISQTTMDEIAKKSEYSKSTIYVYFKSKEDIYYHIVYRGMELFYEKLKNAINVKTDCKTNFFAVCHVLTNIQEESTLYFESILNTILVDDVNMKEFIILKSIYEVGEEINELLIKVFEDGMRKREIREDIDPFQTIFMMWASIGGIIKMATQKSNYLKEKKGITQDEFLNYSFLLLYQSLL